VVDAVPDDEELQPRESRPGLTRSSARTTHNHTPLLLVFIVTSSVEFGKAPKGCVVHYDQNRQNPELLAFSVRTSYGLAIRVPIEIFVVIRAGKWEDEREESSFKKTRDRGAVE
jgi:hypothetical protein